MAVKDYVPKKMDLEAPATPCGLQAKSYFNDEYKLSTADGNKLDLNLDKIAWPNDLEYRFKNV